jgi:hypothetical protein
MNTSKGVISLVKPAISIEWKLLAFLILFMDVKLAVKLFAIILVYILQPDFKFGFRIKDSRLPLFYLIVSLIALVNFIFNQDFSANYISVVTTGILIWTVCILAVHQVKLFVERTGLDILHNTLMVFFILNIAFSGINLSFIWLHIGFRNPFQYQGQYQKYFINTGDYIKGITADTSTTNALISCFGIVYFLYRKKFWLVLASMVILLMTASNFSNIIMLIVFAAIFIFKSTPEQKSIMAACSILLVIFFAKISPQNDTYVTETFNNFIFHKKHNSVPAEKPIPIRERPDSLLTSETRKEKTAVLFLDSLERERIKEYARLGIHPKGYLKRPLIPADSIHTASFQWSRDTTLFQRQLLTYIYQHLASPQLHYPEESAGKVQAIGQSLHFLKDHKDKILAGTGIGNFSSKLAFRATGLKMAGGFPVSLMYCNYDFLKNHLSLYTYFFTKQAESHSMIHSPANVYDQLLTEYGLLGLLALLFFYIGFFLRDIKKLTYGLPVTGILLSFFMVDYWFEQLSVVVLFELIMFINIKENSKPPAHA